MGEFQLVVNCSNLVYSIEKDTNITSWNPCFTRDGIFDHKFSKSSTALKGLTSVVTTLASRMGVKCYDYDPGPVYVWEIYRLNSWDPNNLTEVTIPIPANTKGSLLLDNGVLEPGSYRISLNVSLTGE